MACICTHGCSIPSRRIPRAASCPRSEILEDFTIKISVPLLILYGCGATTRVGVPHKIENRGSIHNNNTANNLLWWYGCANDSVSKFQRLSIKTEVQGSLPSAHISESILHGQRHFVFCSRECFGCGRLRHALCYWLCGCTTHGMHLPCALR
jgi:hypothetical protein